MGRDKAALPFGGETLLHRTVRILETVVSDVVLVGREGQVLPTSRNAVRDAVEGLGPLAAIAAGLAAIRHDRAFVTGCDMPFLRPALVERMLTLSRGYEAAVPLVDGVAMTTCAVYARSLAPHAEALVAAGQLRLFDLMARSHTRLVAPGELTDVDPTLESFRNCNTPEEYVAALRDAGLDPPAEPHRHLGRLC